MTLIVFDLDGTLLDGYAGISDALGFAMERRIVRSKALFCLVPWRTDKGPLCRLPAVSVGGEGTVAGAVYRPVDEMLPAEASPPTILFTAQTTSVVAGPASSAVNCCVPFGTRTAAGGLTVSRPSTRNGSGDVAVPRGVVTVIWPVSAPDGTMLDTTALNALYNRGDAIGLRPRRQEIGCRTPQCLGY